MAEPGPQPLGRTACPECGDRVLVNRDGRLRHHGSRTKPGVCPGSRQPAPGGSVRVLRLKDGVVIKVTHAPGTLAEDSFTDELVMLDAEWAELQRIIGQAGREDVTREH